MDIKFFVSWAAWPVLFAICLVITAYGFASPYPILGFNVAYVFLIISLLALEHWIPHEKAWQKHDGQLLADIAHTLSSKGTVQGLLAFSAVLGLTELITPVTEAGYGIWPREWPMAVQIVMGVVLAEFGLYWAHRLGHEWPILWRFHAVHHSVVRLWTINTGRFHFVDSLISIILAMAILLALGAPIEVVQWKAAITAFIGLLTHCNVDMRFGVLSYIFNTPELHRWHHSRRLDEGNTNYCENVMVWDHVFFTYYNPSGRRPPVNIGTDEYMPVQFLDQLLWPFLSEERKNIIKTRDPGGMDAMAHEVCDSPVGNEFGS